MKVLLPILLLASFALIGCHDDHVTPAGPSPATITGFTPAEVNRGDNNVTGKIAGTNFTGVTAVSLGEGISVKSYNVDGVTQITVHFSVSKLAETGGRSISVTSVAGTANSTGNLLSVARHDPIAIIQSVAKGNTQEAVHFSGSRSYNPDGGRITDFTWDFDDGSKRVKGQEVNHKFDRAGTYNVSLTVSDSKGGKGDSNKKVQIEKVTEIACKSPGKVAGGVKVKFGTITKVDVTNRVVEMRFNQPSTCGNTYWRCGDVKDGYFNHRPERFFGAICGMWDVGNNTFRIQVGPHGPAWPPQAGNNQAWIHWQDCTGAGFYCGHK